MTGSLPMSTTSTTITDNNTYYFCTICSDFSITKTPLNMTTLSSLSTAIGLSVKIGLFLGILYHQLASFSLFNNWNSLEFLIQRTLSTRVLHKLRCLLSKSANFSTTKRLRPLISTKCRSLKIERIPFSFYFLGEYI